MEVDQRDVARINGALKELEALSGKTMTRLIKGATVQASKSAAKHTHAYTPGKKRKFDRIRIAQDYKGRKKREKKGVPWWAIAQVYAWRAGKPKNSQNEIILYARTESSLAKKRNIPYKGVAKRAWLFSLRRLDRSMGATKPVDSIAKKYNKTMIYRMAGNITGITMVNTVNYAVFANKGAVGKAINKTANWLQKRVQKEEEKLVKAFERKAARATARAD